MPPFKYWRFLAAMLTLAGCAAQTQPSPGFHFVGDPAYRERLSPDARALQIAFAYNADFMRGGMAGVIHDVERCYRTTSIQVGAPPDALRDCMTLDYTAYNIDQVDGRQVNGRSLPFFTDAAEKARLAEYGPAAQFDSVAHEIAYLKDMHQLVQRHLIIDWKVRSAHCTRAISDPDCGYLPTPQ